MPTDQKESDRRRYETAWLKPFTETIPEWDSLSFIQRHLAREGKVFVLWRLNDTMQSEVLDVLTVSGFNCNLAGPQMLMMSRFNAGLCIATAPQKLQDQPVLLWMPAFFDTRFAPYSYDHGNPLQRQLTWRFCVRTASNPHCPGHHRAGQVFFSDAAEFHKLWPVVAF